MNRQLTTSKRIQNEPRKNILHVKNAEDMFVRSYTYRYVYPSELVRVADEIEFLILERRHDDIVRSASAF
jgi:hypothetical protein